VLAQSPCIRHIFFTAHFGQSGPPQSMSVSIPSFIPSLHCGVVQIPAMQPLLSQSTGFVQVFPAGQPMQTPPPQSTSDSPPFFTPSVQVGATHFPMLQKVLWQSLPTLQPRPVPQGLQEPPQSLAVSSPSCLPSLQLDPLHPDATKAANRIARIRSLLD
jgi:hypothetical protein